MAEAKPTTPEGVDIIQTLKYLQERETELSRYSDKLRKAVQKIIDVFGWKELCRECGELCNKHPAGHQFVPKIYISIEVIDEQPFYVDDDGDEFKLVLKDGRLWIGQFTFNGYFTRPVDDVSRKIVKELVKSGRLIKFLEVIRKQLDKTATEYQEVSLIAQKLAECFQS
ncbi:MAG: hypothetical protein QXV39_07940 [Candidatus Caldarchaeum sp.]